jgi:hypothetical protein
MYEVWALLQLAISLHLTTIPPTYRPWYAVFPGVATFVSIPRSRPCSFEGFLNHTTNSQPDCQLLVVPQTFPHIAQFILTMPLIWIAHQLLLDCHNISEKILSFLVERSPCGQRQTSFGSALLARVRVREKYP